VPSLHDLGCVTYCLGGRRRRCRKLLNRRSAQAVDCPSVTVGYPESLSDRARSGHGIDPQRMTAAPCRGWPASGPGRLLPGPWLLTGGGAEAPRSRVAVGHFRRKREAPLTVEGHPRTLSGPSPDPGLATALHLPLACVVVDQVAIVRPGSSADSCQRDVSYFHRALPIRVRRAA
jgi:hypothetical protein